MTKRAGSVEIVLYEEVERGEQMSEGERGGLEGGGAGEPGATEGGGIGCAGGGGCVVGEM